jgi:hypothetical protein
VGYYNKLEVEQNADIDRIVTWYGANKDLPDYLMNYILVNKQLLEDVIGLWEAAGSKDFSRPAPKPVRKVKGRRSTYIKPRFELTTVAAIGIIVSIWALALIGAVLLAGA